MAGRLTLTPTDDPREPSTERDAAAPQRHATALSELFQHHNRTLVIFLTGRLGNEAEAREVAQEAYVRLLQVDRPGAVSFLRAYLFKTAANIAMDRLRRRVRADRAEAVFDEEELTNTLDPGREVGAREELAIVRQALLELPARYRQAFLMARFEEMATPDIGARLGLKETQTRKYLRRVTAYCRLRLDGLTEAEAKEQVFP
jgi:RNA polymerase sigma factor (sigma-70 family)